MGAPIKGFRCVRCDATDAGTEIPGNWHRLRDSCCHNGQRANTASLVAGLPVLWLCPRCCRAFLRFLKEQK